MQKVLIIDDEKPTLAMFQLYLEAYGFEVLTAENGEQGILIFEKEKPDIVFTDIKMPGMDGFEVLRRIKVLVPEAVVIVTTGHGDKDLEKKALDLNATDFLHKPLNSDVLRSLLTRLKKVVESNT